MRKQEWVDHIRNLLKERIAESLNTANPGQVSMAHVKEAGANIRNAFDEVKTVGDLLKLLTELVAHPPSGFYILLKPLLEDLDVSDMEMSEGFGIKGKSIRFSKL